MTNADDGLRAAGAHVVVKGVSKTYMTKKETTHTLNPIDMDIKPGEFVSVLGPSGCGKSTLLMMIGGLTSPTSGQVIIDGIKVDGAQAAAGVVFQDATLLPWRTVIQNVLLQLQVRRLPVNSYMEKCVQLLREHGLAGFENAYPEELSGGMRQRVSIVRALIHDPPLLLMDEPFGALDSLTRSQLNVDLQRRWINNRQTIVFVTHDIDEAVFLSDRILVMGPRPAQIDLDLSIDIERPRRLSERSDPRYGEYANQIRKLFFERGVFREDVSNE